MLGLFDRLGGDAGERGPFLCKDSFVPLQSILFREKSSSLKTVWKRTFSFDRIALEYLQKVITSKRKMC